MKPLLTVVPGTDDGQPAAAPADVNAAILEVVHQGMTGRRDAAAHRGAMKEKARLFIDFDHFRQLCVDDLRQAYHADRHARSRMTKNRRLTWIAMFRYYAAQAGIKQNIAIVALDRQGNYACKLIDKAPRDDWSKFVRLGQTFGISEEELSALYRAKQEQAA